MKFRRSAWFVLLLGMIAIVSSWFSIGPAADYRYRSMLERHERDPDLVSNDEWVISKDDAGMTAVAMLFLGVPAFLIATVAGVVFSFVPNRRLPIPLVLGASWVLLGGALHAMAWLS